MTATVERVSIDLSHFADKPTRVYAGRDWGKAARQQARLDELDGQDVVVEVRVPPDVYSVNSSFFLAMFGPSIRALGEEAFRARYQFVGRDIGTTIEDGIYDATRGPQGLF